MHKQAESSEDFDLSLSPRHPLLFKGLEQGPLATPTAPNQRHNAIGANRAQQPPPSGEDGEPPPERKEPPSPSLPARDADGQSPGALPAGEEAGAGPAPAGAEELEQKLMHLRRVNESLVERVEFFERAQVTDTNGDGGRRQRKEWEGTKKT